MYENGVLLDPISLVRTNGSRNSRLQSMAEILLLIAIRDQSDLLLFRRNVQDAFLCKTLFRINDELVEGVPFPLYFSGILINHFRSIFKLQHPEKSCASRVTIDGKHWCDLKFTVLGASPEGLMQIEIHECDLPADDCSAVINEYFNQRQHQKTLARRSYDALRDWVVGNRQQPYER